MREEGKISWDRRDAGRWEDKRKRHGRKGGSVGGEEMGKMKREVGREKMRGDWKISGEEGKITGDM